MKARIIPLSILGVILLIIVSMCLYRSLLKQDSVCKNIYSSKYTESQH